MWAGTYYEHRTPPLGFIQQELQERVSFLLGNKAGKMCGGASVDKSREKEGGEAEQETLSSIKVLAHWVSV